MLGYSEARSAFDRLEEAVREADLGWMLNEVRQRIRAGNLEERKITTYKQEFYSDAGQEFTRIRPAGKASLATAVPLTPADEVNVLVDAIEQTVVVTALMRRELAEFFASELQGLEDASRKAPLTAQLSFPEPNERETPAVEGEGPADSLVIELEVDREEVEAAERLQRLLNELRAELR